MDRIISSLISLMTSIYFTINKMSDKLFKNRKRILDIVCPALTSIETISNISKESECQKKNYILNTHYKQLDDKICTIIHESWYRLPILPCKRKKLKEIARRIHIIRDGILHIIVVKAADEEDINQQRYFEENPEVEVKYNRQYIQKIASEIEKYKPSLHEILKVLKAEYLIE